MPGLARRPARDTLVEGLVEGALRHPYAVTFFPASKEGIDLVDLEDSSARRAAAFLRQGITPGSLVGLLGASRPDLLVNFFGALRIGAVVSVLPTNHQAAQYDHEVERLSRFIRSGGVRHLAAGEPFRALADRLCTANPDISVLDPGAPNTPRTALPPVSAAQRALVLFTAGRTGQPRAVARSHGQLMAGLQAFRGAIGVTPDDSLVQWLPLSHPLGLFALLGQVLYGGTTHVFPPTVLANRPGDILRCIAEHHVRVTAGGNSSYETLCDACDARGPGSLDLSRWRVAITAGEPVLAATVERFRRTFALAGVRKTTMHPMYYVTEAVLAVTGKLPDTEPDVLTIDQRALFDTGKIRFIRSECARMRAYVSSGVPVDDIDFRIANEEGVDVGNGVLGEIQIRSAAIACGYHRDLRATMKSMDGGWLHTGDRGFVWRGQLFVAGEDQASEPDRAEAGQRGASPARSETPDLVSLN